MYIYYIIYISYILYICIYAFYITHQTVKLCYRSIRLTCHKSTVLTILLKEKDKY